MKDAFKFEKVFMENCKEEVILGISINSKLTFDSNANSICRKSGQKVCTLSRMSP